MLSFHGAVKKNLEYKLKSMDLGGLLKDVN